MRRGIAASSLLLFLIPMFPGDAAAQVIRCADVASDVPRTYTHDTLIPELLTADFDGDGHRDVLALGVDAAIFYGRGDGSFEAPAVLTAYLSNAAIGDINGDGLLDIIGNQAGNFYDYPNRGNRRFDSFGFAPGSSQSDAAVIRDFTGDGHADVLINRSGAPPALFVRESDRFGERAAAAVVFQEGALVAGDFDRDGHLDFAGRVAGVNAVALMRGDGQGQFTLQYLPPLLGAYAPRLAADLNGDGRDELVTFTNNELVILYKPMDAASYVRLPAKNLYTVRAADLNGDGATDLLAWGPRSDSYGIHITVYQNDGHGGFTARNDFAGRGPNVTGPAGAIADVNGDGAPDLIAGASSFAVFFGRGDGTFRTPRIELPVATRPLAALDLDGDGVDELITAGGSQLDVGTRNGATYTFERVPFDAESYSVTSIGNQLIAGSGIWVRIFSRDAQEKRWRETKAFKAGGDVIALAALDGGKFAAVTWGFCNAMQIYDLNGTLVQELPLPCSQRVMLQSVDFDRDGRRDLIAANSGHVVYDNVRMMAVPQFNGSVQLYRGRADGTLEPPITSLTERQIFAMSAGDFNGDRRIDVALASVEKNSSPQLEVFHGDGAGGFLATSLRL
ncbi:MAG TPA: VCBS repeat-containing protein, partial [Thermoanaerobaculia bacterium]|nr:VCBS repeat-containing protein [Thermoanaerobaculia bacterium]